MTTLSIPAASAERPHGYRVSFHSLWWFSFIYLSIGTHVHAFVFNIPGGKELIPLVSSWTRRVLLRE